MVRITPQPLYLWKTLGVHHTEGWVGLWVGLKSYRESSPPPVRFDHRTVKRVSIRSTNYAIPAYNNFRRKHNLLLMKELCGCNLDKSRICGPCTGSFLEFPNIHTLTLDSSVTQLTSILKINLWYITIII